MTAQTSLDLGQAVEAWNFDAPAIPLPTFAGLLGVSGGKIGEMRSAGALRLSAGHVGHGNERRISQADAVRICGALAIQALRIALPAAEIREITEALADQARAGLRTGAAVVRRDPSGVVVSFLPPADAVALASPAGIILAAGNIITAALTSFALAAPGGPLDLAERAAAAGSGLEALKQAIEATPPEDRPPGLEAVAVALWPALTALWRELGQLPRRETRNPTVWP